MNKIIYTLRSNLFRNMGFPYTPPRIVILGITNMCNSRCRTCGIWKIYKNNPDKLKDELTLDEFKRFVDKNPFIDIISLTGGEPTLKEDLNKYILYMNTSTGFSTNSVNPKRIKEVISNILNDIDSKNNLLISISLDGFKEQHNIIRGLDVYDNTIKMLEWLKEKQKKYPNLKYRVSHTLTETNYKTFPKFVRFLEKKGIDISFRPMNTTPLYYGKFEKDEAIKNKEASEIVKQTLSHINLKTRTFNNIIVKYLKNPNYRVKCYAGYTFCYIDPYWNVFPCINFPKKIGNLRDYDFDLKELCRSKKAKEVREMVKNNECSNCCNSCTTMNSIRSDLFGRIKLMFNG